VSAAALLPVARGCPRRSAGQSLVEFALVIPIFLLLLCSLFDAGRLVYMNGVLSQAAREAARVASVEASWLGSHDASCNKLGGPVCPATLDALFADATAAANRMVAPLGSIPSGSVFMSCDVLGSGPTGAWKARSCNSPSTGDVVSVRVELTFTAITPVIGQLIPLVILSGFSTMVIN
jgi:hypothetical protein